MLTLDLAELDRRGRLPVEGELAPDLPLWEGLDLRVEEPVEIQLEAQATSSGEVLVRGTVYAQFSSDCRRCLEPVRSELEEEVAILFTPPDQLSVEDRGGEIRVLDPEGNTLDLGPAIREEVLLDAPAWVVCRPDCRGLCPSCGTNRNENTCDCTHCLLPLATVVHSTVKLYIDSVQEPDVKTAEVMWVKLVSPIYRSSV